MKKIKFEVPHPDPKVFLHDPSIIRKSPRLLFINKVEYPKDGGIEIHYNGEPYPKTSFPYPAAVESVCDVKRVVRMLFTLAQIKPTGALFWLFQRRVLKAFVLYGTRALERHYLKPLYLPQPIQHLLFAGLTAAKKEEERELVWIISHIVYYDSGYRTFFQKIAELAHKEKPKNLLKWAINEGLRLDKTRTSKWKEVLLAYPFLPYKSFLERWANNLNLPTLFQDESDRYHYPIDWK